VGTVRSLDLEVRDLDLDVRSLELQVRELRTEERAGARTTVTISTDVLFDFDSAELTPSAVAVVEDLAARIAGAGGAADVLVVGHTDGIGSREYNQGLSERRAAAVAAVLGDRLGAGRNIITEGRNFSEPVAPETANGEDDPEARARNRRVEISFDETP
jgi:outer membrane protein OmpA-like peptidoglycan-associated protein